jgi:hypothetical protein
LNDNPFRNNTHMVATSIVPVGPTYFIAERRAEAATRRGDLKAAQAWLSVAERHMALAERNDRGRMKRERQIAWQADERERRRANEAPQGYPPLSAYRR